MKRLLLVGFVALALFLSAGAAPSYAERGGWRGGGRGGWHRGGGHWEGGFSFGISPFWWGPGWGYPFYPYFSAYPPPVVVEEQPPVYVEPPSAEPEPEPEAYWYYCSSAKAYYPYVRSCPEPWVRVPANPR